MLEKFLLYANTILTNAVSYDIYDSLRIKWPKLAAKDQ